MYRYLLFRQTGSPFLLAGRIHVVHAKVLQQGSHVDEAEERLEANICEQRGIKLARKF